MTQPVNKAILPVEISTQNNDLLKNGRQTAVKKQMKLKLAGNIEVDSEDIIVSSDRSDYLDQLRESGEKTFKKLISSGNFNYKQ